MLNFNETNNINKKQSFFPPIKHSQNKLLLTNKNAVLVENNLSKEKEFLEVSLDKFSLLTNQPKSVEKIKLNTFMPKNSTSLENVLFPPQATNSTSFEWNSKEMPKLKISRFNDAPSKSVNESSADKKKRLLFEQKRALEQKQYEKNMRHLRSNEYLSHSNDTFKKIVHRHGSIKDNMDYNQISKPDLWSSDNFKDINLKKDIIQTFYSLDNRHIRDFRKYNEDYFNLTMNKNYENMRNQTLLREHQEIMNVQNN